jgi:hypothetical protein
MWGPPGGGDTKCQDFTLPRLKNVLFGGVLGEGTFFFPTLYYLIY